MQPYTRPSDYKDSAVFQKELTHLFHPSWQFAGFTHDLTNDGDFIVCQVGDKSVLIHNFSGDLRAFLNVCVHRFSAIRSECKGNGPVQCQYHGWVYNRTGLAVGIANIKGFDDITDQRRRELSLDCWDLEICGALIFVRDARCNGANLREFLGDAWQVIESFSGSLGAQIDCNRMVINANWKVVVENTLESYHVHSVHPETFATLSVRAGQFRFDPPHSSWSADIDPKMAAGLSRLVRRLGIESSFEGYFHQLVFPNVTLATTYGLTYALQTILPLSPDRTEFTSYVFAAHANARPASQNQILLESSMPAVEFNRAVFEEDRLVCEQVQRGIQQASANLTGELSREESRVYDFQRAWKAAIDNH